MKRLVSFLLVCALACGCGDAVGEIESYDPVAKKNGAQDFSDDLKKKDELVTETNGQIRFSLKEKIKQCTMYGNSRLIVHPRSGILIEFDYAPPGTPVVCGTTNNPGKWTLTTNQAKIDGDDPVFSIGTNETETVVKVVFGFVNVTTIGFDEAVRVGPLQQTLVVGEMAPIAPIPIQLSDFEVGAFEEFLIDVPDLPLGALEDAGRLTDALERDVIIVAFDAGFDGDLFAIELAAAVGERLASEWDAVMEFVASDDSLGQYRAGDADLVLTHERGLGETVPFVSVGDEVLYLASPGDASFVDGFGVFYRGFLEAGGYREALAALGVPVSYGIFEELLTR